MLLDGGYFSNPADRPTEAAMIYNTTAFGNSAAK